MVPNRRATNKPIRSTSQKIWKFLEGTLLSGVALGCYISGISSLKDGDRVVAAILFGIALISIIAAVYRAGFFAGQTRIKQGLGFGSITVLAVLVLVVTWIAKQREEPIENRATLDVVEAKVYHDGLFLKADILIQNRGKMYVEKWPMITCGLFVKDAGLSLDDEDELFSRMHDEERKTAGTSKENPIKPGEFFPLHCGSELPFGDPASFELMLKDVYAGKRLIYMITKAYFKDRVGPLYQESCYVFKGLDRSSGQKCWGHNGAPKPELRQIGPFP